MADTPQGFPDQAHCMVYIIYIVESVSSAQPSSQQPENAPEFSALAAALAAPGLWITGRRNRLMRGSSDSGLR